MDPVSALFSAYLDFVSNNVHQQMTDTLGTEVKALVIHPDIRGCNAFCL